MRERFDREARAVAALSHPNIVAIYDVGTHEDTPYAAIELLDGETLASVIQTSALPLERAHAAGWMDARTTRLMPMGASLRGNERFERLVQRMEADVAAMRTRADYAGLP